MKERKSSLIKRSGKDLAKMAEALPVAAHILHLDHDGILRLTFGTAEVYDLFGVPANKLKRDFFEISQHTHPEDSNLLREKFKDALNHLTDFHHSWRILHPEKGEIWVECQSSPEKQEDGTIKWYGYLQDITRIKQSEAQNLSLINYLEKLDQINRAIQSKSRLDDMLLGVLDTLIKVFDCEQAALIYPCDPNANTIKHIFNRVKPGLTGAYSSIQEEVKADSRTQRANKRLLQANSVICGSVVQNEGEAPLPLAMQPESFMATAITPKMGQAWMLGLHQCNSAREWHPDEKQLLSEVSTRLSEALVSVIASRDLAASEERFRQMADSIEEVFWLIDSDMEKFDLLYVSPGFEKIWGIPTHELYKDPYLWWDAVPEEDQFAQRKLVEFYLDKDRLADEIEVEYRIHSLGGSLRYIREKAFVVHNEHGEVYRFAGIAQDITQKKKQDAQIEHLAFHDALTGLNNRTAIIETLRREIYLCDTSTNGLAVLFVDLDNFKAINDSLGHLAGDRLLEQVSNKLNRLKGDENFIGRVGGDEFIIIIRNVDSLKTVANAANAIISTLKQPISVLNHELHVGASIGISMCPRDAKEAQTLIKYADNALYAAKEQGRNRVRFFSPELDAKIRARLLMETDLRHAIERNELKLHYQIQVNTSTNTVSGVEALLRWQHPIFGLVSPDEFIPLAEETGLIIEIGEWVLNEACRQIVKWKDKCSDNLVMSVNISRKQLEEKKFASNLRKILLATNCPPENIELEITESSAMNNPQRAIKKLKLISDLGVQLALDDFGTGYSNLAYLKRFPFDRLKIDQSFVADIPNDPDDVAIIQTIILLAKQLRLKVIAEGVETKGQKQFLLENGCAEMQGYYFSRPVAPEEAVKKLFDDQRVVSSLEQFRKGKKK